MNARHTETLVWLSEHKDAWPGIGSIPRRFRQCIEELASLDMVVKWKRPDRTVLVLTPEGANVVGVVIEERWIPKREPEVVESKEKLITKLVEIPHWERGERDKHGDVNHPRRFVPTMPNRKGVEKPSRIPGKRLGVPNFEKISRTLAAPEIEDGYVSEWDDDGKPKSISREKGKVPISARFFVSDGTSGIPVEVDLRTAKKNRLVEKYKKSRKSQEKDRK